MYTPVPRLWLHYVVNPVYILRQGYFPQIPPCVFAIDVQEGPVCVFRSSSNISVRMAPVFFNHPRMVIAVPLPLSSSVLAVGPGTTPLLIRVIYPTSPHFESIGTVPPLVRWRTPFAIVVTRVYPITTPPPLIVISGIAKPPRTIDEDVSGYPLVKCRHVRHDELELTVPS